LPATELLIEVAADLSARVKLPGHYERFDEVIKCTAVVEGKTVGLLRERGGVE
jgi:hypothetical protein